MTSAQKAENIVVWTILLLKKDVGSFNVFATSVGCYYKKSEMKCLSLYVA